MLVFGAIQIGRPSSMDNHSVVAFRRRLAFLAGSWLGVAVVVMLITATAAYAEKRVALVVGNSAYQKVPALPNPLNDAVDIATSLERLGFAVRG